ncbi:hypothetical protein KGO95_00485 [Patescibacteria group bacterium]|nr:hypothetical protein [Patescibacteria group bacterium]
MKRSVIAPHRVRLNAESHFREQLCFPWGSPFGFVNDRDWRLIQKHRQLDQRKKPRRARSKKEQSGNYVLVYRDTIGTPIEPPEIRIGSRKGEMTFRARMFLCSEVFLT